MFTLEGIFFSGTYLAIALEVKVAVGCVLAYICNTVESLCPCNMLAVSYIWNMAVIFVQ